MFWMLHVAANSGTEVRVGNKRTPSAQCRTSRARGTWFRQARLLDRIVNYRTRETIRPIVGQRDEFSNWRAKVYRRLDYARGQALVVGGG